VKRIVSAALLAASLTGCTHIPVGGVSVCVGKCTITIKSGQPQTAAEKAASATATIFETLFNRGAK